MTRFEEQEWKHLHLQCLSTFLALKPNFTNFLSQAVMAERKILSLLGM
jgi:hypothetical protein